MIKFGIYADLEMYLISKVNTIIKIRLDSLD